MIKVLHYIYGLNIGGAESFLYNMIKSMPKNKYQFDFCIQSGRNENEKLITLIEDNNGKIYHIPAYNKNPFQNKKGFEGLIAEIKPDIVHFHMNALINTAPLKVCEKLNVRYLVHSHNTKSNGGKLAQILHKANSMKLSGKSFGRVACGRDAGKYFYNINEFVVIQNGIILDDYGYSIEKRQIIRSELKIDADTRVIGHVGRFVPAKNHEFILSTFKELRLKIPNSKLILIGDGDLKDEIQKKVMELGISDAVIFTGNISNVPDLLSVFDVFLFPSYFEGLPFTLVEAQAAGLSILTSTNVTKDVDVTGLVKYMDLSKTAKEWADELMKMLNTTQTREEYVSKMKGSIYDIDAEVKKLDDFYQNLLSDKRS